MAAHRLKLLADVYAESTKAFVAEAVNESPSLLVDLGCGPGFTTHLLADQLRCVRAVGLDNAENFIRLARKTETDRVSFLLHDVTRIPFPAGPADVMYCRFLLTHLRNPETVVSNWITQLAPQGVLLVEENEWIHTSNRVLAVYLEIVEAMLKNQSGNLYVGPVLNRLGDADALKVRASTVKQVPVATQRAAAMFSLNIETWKHQPFVVENYSPSLLADLQKDLQNLAKKSGNETEIEWGLRQMAFERG